MNAKNLALNLLIKAKDLASDTLNKFQGKVKDSGDQTEQLDDSLQNAGRATGHFADQLSDADRAAGRFYDKQGRLREANGRFVQGARRAGEAADSFRKRLKNTSSTAESTGSSIKRLATDIAALAGTYLGLSALKNGLLGIINVGARFEQLRIQLNELMGSIEAGEHAVAWIKEFAKTTPADIEGVTQGFVRLKAFGIDPMNGAYQAIVDQTSKLGFSQDKLNGIILAVGQAWSKQKLQGEEALQLIERGVPVWDLLAKATGKNVVELQKLSEQGRIGRKEISLLVQEMGKNAEGAAQAQMSTWNGLISNLKDKWLNFVNDINEAGFLDYAKQQLKELLDQVTEMARDGRLKQYAEDIATALVTMASNVKTFMDSTVGDFDGFIRAVAALIGIFKIAINSVTAGVKTVGLIVSTYFTEVISMAATALEQIPGMGDTAARLQLEADAMKAVSTAFKDSILQDSKDMQDGWKLITGEAFDEARQSLNTLQTDAEETAGAIHDVQNAVFSMEEETARQAREAQEALKAQETAWKTLGLDIAVVREEVSKQGQATIDSFRAIAQEGRASADQIGLAFDAALSKTRTRAEVEALIDILKKARKEGKITGNVFTTAFRHGRDAIKALAKKTDDTKKALSAAGDTGRKAMDSIGDAASNASDSVGELADETARLNRETEKADDQTRSGGSSRIGARQYYDLNKSGNTEAAARFQELADAYGNTMEGLVLGPKGAAVMEAELDKLMQQAIQQTQSVSQAPVNTPAPASATPARTVRIEFAAQGQPSITGDFDESNADQLIRMLSDVGRVAG